MIFLSGNAVSIDTDSLANQFEVVSFFNNDLIRNNKDIYNRSLIRN